MPAPAAGRLSYSAWIIFVASASDRSGVDLHPDSSSPAPINAATPKTENFNAFLTVLLPRSARPTVETHSTRHFTPTLLHVNENESDRAHTHWFSVKRSTKRRLFHSSAADPTSKLMPKSPGSASGNAAQQQVHKPFLVRVQADLGVRRTLHRPGKALVVHLNPKRLRWTKFRVDGICHRDRVEQRGIGGMVIGMRNPLVVEQGQLIGQRRAKRKDTLPLRRVQVDLRRIERHHEDWNTGGEQRLCARWIARNVPLGFWRTRLLSRLHITIAAIDAAAHHHHPLELAKGRGIALDGRPNIGQWPDRNQRDLARVSANLIKQKRDPVGLLALRFVPRIRGLGEHVVVRSGKASGYRNILAADSSQVAINQLRPQLRISKCCRNPQQFQFRTAQSQRQRKRIVDIVANIRVENRELRCRCGLPGSGLTLCTEPRDRHTQRG